MPKLWNDTIEAHRRDVGDAIVNATAKLVATLGLRAVTMSQIAETTGIGRATLYKYFPDVEAILVVWHERQVRGHLELLTGLQRQAGSAAERLEAVLEAYALILHEHRHPELTDLLYRLLHQGEHVTQAERHVRELVRDLLRECSACGQVREDVAPAELASYCLNALMAARQLPSKSAVRRLVAVTIAGLRPADGDRA